MLQGLEGVTEQSFQTKGVTGIGKEDRGRRKRREESKEKIKKEEERKKVGEKEDMKVGETERGNEKSERLA